MKKIFILSALAAAAMAFAACETEQVGPEIIEAAEASLSIEKSELIIPAKGGEAFLVIKSESAFKAVSEKAWCNVTLDADTVRIAAAENGTLDSRYSKVSVYNETDSLSVMVQQFGYKTSGFSTSDITCSSDSAIFDYPYEYDDLLVASVDQDWVTLTVTKDNFSVKIAENTTKATADNRSRKAEISWKLGVEEGKIKVEQLNVDFMQPDANWTVSYDGYKVWEGDGNKYEHIKNDVADPAISGMYFFTYFTKADFTASKLKIGDYVASLVPSLKEEADATIEYYKGTYDLTYEDLLYVESDYEIFDKFEPGDYYACVIGFDKDFSPTGHYAVSEFTRTNDSGPSGYDKWLGEWTCPHGNSSSKTDTWTFTVKEKGVTYWVTGIEGYTDLKIEVEYDEASEGIIARAQEEIGTMTIGTKGECSMGFYGATLAGNLWTPGASPYAIFTATINGDKAQLVPATLKSESGDVQPEIAAYIGKDAKGGFTLPKSFNDATRTNVVLTKKGSGSGDDPGQGSGSEAYNKWLGTWTVPNDEGGSFDFTLSTGVADKTFNLRGWEMDQDFFKDWEVPFDAAKGTAALHVNTNDALASNVSIEGKTDPYDFFYYGTIIYTDGKEYVISGDYDAAIGTIGSDGKATFVGQSIKLQGETEPFTITNFVLCGVNVNNDDDIISWKGESTGFPLTVTKAASGKSLAKSMSLPSGNSVRIDASRILKACEYENVEMKAFTAKSEPERRFKSLVK